MDNEDDSALARKRKSDRVYRQRNKDRKKAYDAVYRAANFDRLEAIRNAYRATHKAEKAAYDRRRYEIEKAARPKKQPPSAEEIAARKKRRNEKAVIRTRLWVAANPERKRARDKEYSVKNKEALKIYGIAYRAKNSARIKVRMKAAYDRLKANPERRAKELERSRKFRADNRDRLNAETRRRRAQNREDHLAEKRAYYRSHPEEYRSSSARRRALKFSAPGTHTKEDLSAIRISQRDQCVYCKADLNGAGHLDHRVSLSKGGSNSPDNLQWTCEGCNRTKGAKDPIEFAKEIGLLLPDSRLTV